MLSRWRYWLVLGLITLWQRTYSYILRLPCQTIAEFKVKRTNTTLQNLSPVATFEAMDYVSCQTECVFHDRCKSFIITKDETCLLFHKSYEDKKDHVALSNEPGSTYFSTLFNETQVGRNCKENNPCAAGKRCFDTCECPGYQCVDIDNCVGNPCRNSGTCSSISTGYRCSCIEGFSGATCEIANTQWHPNCGPPSLHPSSFQSDKTSCYLYCLAQRSAVAYYRKEQKRCSCRNKILCEGNPESECIFLPKEMVTWSKDCSYTGGTHYSEVLSKWHCYYYCKELNYKSMTWTQNNTKCVCSYAEGRSHTSHSECIEL